MPGDMTAVAITEGLLYIGDAIRDLTRATYRTHDRP